MKLADPTKPRTSTSVFPGRGAVEMDAMRFPLMPMLRTASRPDSGSITRPLERTMSNTCPHKPPVAIRTEIQSRVLIALSFRKGERYQRMAGGDGDELAA